MLIGEAAVAVMEAEANRRVRETSRNWGGRIILYLKASGWRTPAPWCMAFIAFALEQVGYYLDKHGLKHEASVGYFAAWARAQGYVVQNPERGVFGCWELTSKNYQWGDHVFGVRGVLSFGQLGWLVSTVEGNTSSGKAGSQSEGDGVYFRTRWIKRGSVVWVKIKAPAPKVVTKENARVSANEFLWREWYLGEGRYRTHGPRNKKVRPNVGYGGPGQKKVPGVWWTRLGKFLERRKKGS